MAKRTTDEVIISLKINNKQAAASIEELEGDLRTMQKLMKGLNPEIEKDNFEKIKKQYDALKDRISQAREEVGLLQRKVETPIDPKSLAGLEKKAGELKKALSEINPEVDKAKFDKMKAEYEGVQKEIDDTKEKLGFVKKAEKDVETGASKIGEAFKQMATAAFWIAMIQQIYELAKAFFEVQKEINGLQTQIGKMTGATGKELDQLVGKTQGISKAFEVESVKVNNAANSIAKNLKISFAEAQDLIKQGLAASAETDKGELLDWYEEYASKLSNSRLKAEEFIAIVSQMKEQGVYTDFGVDAINEYSVTATTETEKLINALKTVEKATGNTFAVQMVKDLETGKIGITDSLKQVTTELAKLPEDSQIAKQAVSEIFKSKGEEVGVAYFQNLSKLGNATDYLNKSSKGYNAQLDQLIESQQTLTATQSELFGKMQSGSKFIDILTNKALTVLYKLLILIVDNSKPLVDLWNNISNSAKNLYTEINLLLKSFGLAGKEGNLMKYIIEGIAAILTVSLMPLRFLILAIAELSSFVRTGANSVGIFWNSLKLLYPSLQGMVDVVNLFIEPWLKIPKVIEQAYQSLRQWIGLSEEARRNAQETEESLSDLGAKLGEKIGGKKTESPNEKTSEKTDYNTNSQAYQDYLQKQKDARQKADAEKLKKAEEVAKAQADIDKKLEEAKLEAIQNEDERKKAQLELNAKREIEEFNKSQATTEQKAEFKRLVEEKLSKDITEIRKKEIDELAAMAKQQMEDEKEMKKTRLQSEVELAQFNLDKAKQKVSDLEKPENEFVDKTAALQAQFDAENALKQAQFDLEIANFQGQTEVIAQLEKEKKDRELIDEKAHADALIAEKMRVAMVQLQNTQMVFGAMKETTQAIVDLFGEQTAAGKAAAIAMKAFSAGEIVASTIVEIQKIWEFANADASNVVIPGWRYGLAAVQTAGVLARRAKSLAELGSIKFKEGGLLPVIDFFTPKFVKKLAKGGYLRGKSHADGGINGTGRFANIQVEGGEFITNKRATALNLPVLEAINTYGDQLDFSHMIKFATGGQIPNTTPSTAAVQAIRTPEPNPMGEMLLMEMMEMRKAFDSYEREKQVIVNYSNIETAADKMATVREY